MKIDIDQNNHSTYCVGRLFEKEKEMIPIDPDWFPPEEWVMLSDIHRYYNSGRIRYPLNFTSYLSSCECSGQSGFDVQFGRRYMRKSVSPEELCGEYESMDHCFAAFEFRTAHVPVVIYRLANHSRIKRATFFANGKQICFVRNARPGQGYVHSFNRLGLNKGESFLTPTDQPFVCGQPPREYEAAFSYPKIWLKIWYKGH